MSDEIRLCFGGVSAWPYLKTTMATNSVDVRSLAERAEMPLSCLILNRWKLPATHVADMPVRLCDHKPMTTSDLIRNQLHLKLYGVSNRSDDT